MGPAQGEGRCPGGDMDIRLYRNFLILFGLRLGFESTYMLFSCIALTIICKCIFQ